MIIMFSIFLNLFFSTSGFPAESFKVQVDTAAMENNERNVDEVAIDAQEGAIYKLKTLLIKYRGKQEEALFLERLADLQQQNAAIRFRIAHGKSHNKKVRLDLNAYHRVMNESIETLTQLIKKYPSYKEICLAYFMRAKAYEELENKDLAIKDYTFLVKNFPDDEKSPAAYMALAEFSILLNNHSSAINYLNKVEKDSPHYPFALYKLAWAYYNLKDVNKSLYYIEKNIDFYNKKTTQSSSDLALKENSLSDSALFYLEGYEQNLNQYDINKAFSYFYGLDSGSHFGKVVLKFANLLRAHSHEEDLVKWKNIVIKEASNRPEALDVVISTYESQLNKRRYSQLIDTAQDFIHFKKKYSNLESMKKAQNLLLETAESLQTIILKNKMATGIAEYSKYLALTYNVFTQVVEESDNRIPKIHYNLAEILFQIKDYGSATDNYRWVVDHNCWNKTDLILCSGSSLKAIGSRYEYLIKESLIPKDLVAKDFSKEDDKKIDPKLLEWIEWIDTHISKTNEDVDNFYFEANRSLYFNNRIAQSIKRLRDFSLKKPGSKFAIPSASLVLDTYIASSDWDSVYTQSNEFIKIKEWDKSGFSKKLNQMAAESFYKNIEKLYSKKDYYSSLNAVDNFIKKYPNSQRMIECLFVAGNSATALNNDVLAKTYYSSLIKNFPNSELIRSSLIARATIFENNFEFDKAAQDLKLLLNLQNKPKEFSNVEVLELKKKLLLYFWITADSESLYSVVKKDFCNSELEIECDKYLALFSDNKNIESILSNYRKHTGEIKTIWAIKALSTAKELSTHDKLLVMKNIAENWSELSPLIKYSLIHDISYFLPNTLRSIRLGLSKTDPLIQNDRYISRRIEVVSEIEKISVKIAKIPLLKIRALVLNEVADLYLDLVKGLKSLPLPKKESSSYSLNLSSILIPFEEKAQTIRKEAFTMASNSVIEEEAFNLISVPFFQDNPSQAILLKKSVDKYPIVPISLNLIQEIDSSWNNSSIKKPLDEAFRNNNFPLIGFVIQTVQSRKIANLMTSEALNSIALSKAGAQAESISGLENLKNSLEVQSRSKLAKLLIGYYSASFNKEKIQKIKNNLINSNNSIKEKL